VPVVLPLAELVPVEPEPDVDVVVSVVTEVESLDAFVPPLPPQAANAPNTNTNSNFFIVSLFIVIVDLGVNAIKKKR
jgi:hypothetical protein